MDEIIYKYLNNELSQDKVIELINWIEESPENKAYFMQLRQIWDMVLLDTKNKFDEKAYNKVLSRIDIKQKRKSKVYYILANIAAILIIVFGLYFFINPTEKHPEIISKIIMPSGHKGDYVLPDGSVVWLNSGTTIEYADNFLKNRKVKVVFGEVYFSVTANKNNPFIVNAGKLDVHVLGTRFYVLNNNDFSETTVVSGKVKVVLKNQTEHILMPNQKIRVSNDSLSLETVNSNLYTNWINNKLEFDKIKLKDVFVSLEHWYNVTILCDDPQIAETKVTLTVRNENIDEILKAISKITNTEYVHDNKQIKILKTKTTNQQRK